MKNRNILNLIVVSIIGITAISSSVYAGPARGQKLYMKKLKKACHMSGDKMAQKHTQEEWLKLKEDGKLKEEIQKICPDLKKLKDKYVPDLFDFFYEYGSDSGNVPSC